VTRPGLDDVRVRIRSHDNLSCVAGQRPVQLRMTSRPDEERHMREAFVFTQKVFVAYLDPFSARVG